MSLYRPRNSPYWHYDFVYKGCRVYGSTGQKERRKAAAVEARHRFDAAMGIVTPAEYTLDVAAQRWWQERGSLLRSADDVEHRIAVLISILGRSRSLHHVTTDAVASAIAERLSQKSRFGKPLSNSTVNRDIIDTLRPIVNRARKVWGVVGLPEIAWSELRLPEPKPKPRDFNQAEVTAFLGRLPAHWRDFAEFQATYGCRLSEMFFALADFDPEGARLVLRHRKGDADHVIPLLPSHAAMLRARLGRAKSSNLDTVWFRELRSGKLKALTYWAAQHALSDAMRAVGLDKTKGARGSHDLRHHAAMRMLRETGNLRITQKLLGHASIQSTLVYAHAQESDLRAALEQVSRSSPERSQPEKKKRPRKQRSRR